MSMERAIEAMNKFTNNTTVLNILMLGCFGTLSMRSWIQQNQIEALAAEKESFSKTNTSLKETIWEWKQTLYSEAEKDGKNAAVSVKKLREIYGDTTTTYVSPVLDGGGMQQGVEKAHGQKLLI